MNSFCTFIQYFHTILPYSIFLQYFPTVLSYSTFLQYFHTVQWNNGFEVNNFSRAKLPYLDKQKVCTVMFYIVLYCSVLLQCRMYRWLSAGTVGRWGGGRSPLTQGHRCTVLYCTVLYNTVQWWLTFYDWKTYSTEYYSTVLYL